MRKNAPFDISDELLEKMSKKDYIKKLHSDCPMTHIQTLSGRFTITVEREYGLQRVYSTGTVCSAFSASMLASFARIV